MNTLTISLKSLLVFTCVFAGSFLHAADACHPLANNQLKQYVVGYGSLMETASKQRTYPSAGESMPVMLEGFQRGWFAPGTTIGFGTTFLAVIPKASATLNAVVFQITSYQDLDAFDKREQGYCRQAVPLENIHSLTPQQLEPAQYWIYYLDAAKKGKPSSDYPIVQSYVDIFLNGCFEVEDKYHLNHFSNQCVSHTGEWSTHWVNDRIYPRRPFIYQPNAGRIDKFLQTNLPEHFKAIEIE